MNRRFSYSHLLIWFAPAAAIRLGEDGWNVYKHGIEPPTPVFRAEVHQSYLAGSSSVLLPSSHPCTSIIGASSEPQLEPLRTPEFASTLSANSYNDLRLLRHRRQPCDAGRLVMRVGQLLMPIVGETRTDRRPLPSGRRNLGGIATAKSVAVRGPRHNHPDSRP